MPATARLITTVADINALEPGTIFRAHDGSVAVVDTYAWNPSTLTGFMDPDDGDPRYLKWAGTELTECFPLPRDWSDIASDRPVLVLWRP